MKSTSKLLYILLAVGLCSASVVVYKGIYNLNRLNPLEKVHQLFKSKESQDLVDIIKRSVPAVVLIHSFSDPAKKDHLIYNSALRPRESVEDYDHAVTSGVIIHKDGYIATPYDTIKNSSRIIVSINSENRKNNIDSSMIITDEDYEAKVVREIPELNITILKIENKDKEDFKCIELGSTFEYATDGHKQSKNLANTGFSVGKAKGTHFVTQTKYANSVNNFGISANPIENMAIEKIEGVEYLTLNNTVSGSCMSPENAGGAVIDKSGKMIGMVDYTKTSKLFFLRYVAIPANIIEKALYIAVPTVFKEMINKEKIGITFINDPEGEEGVYIETVEKDSRADKSGLLQSDVITKINNEPVGNANIFQNMLDRSIGDGSLVLTVRRGRSVIEVEVLN